MHVSGGKGYDYILRRFVPMLRDRGVTEAHIHNMLVANPADIFSMPIDAAEAA